MTQMILIVETKFRNYPILKYCIIKHKKETNLKKKYGQLLTNKNYKSSTLENMLLIKIKLSTHF